MRFYCITALFLIFSSFELRAELTNSIPAIEPIAGVHFQLIKDPPITSQLSNTSFVKFYFWPGSESCYQLELALQQWQKQHPNIFIQRIPLVKRPQWRFLAKVWLTAQQHQQEEQKLLNGLYKKIHQQSQQINELNQLTEMFLSLNIDPLDFNTRFNSTSINKQLKTLQDQATLFPIRGVPTIIIDNQWITDASMANTSAQIIKILEQLLMNKIQLDTLNGS